MLWLFCPGPEVVKISDEDCIWHIESGVPSLQKSYCWVAEVEAVGAEHAQEDGEEERRLEVVAVGPLARHVAEEGAADKRYAGEIANFSHF